MTNFTPEQILAAKAAKSPEELIAMAKEQSLELTTEQASRFLASASELDDEELDNVAGGGCGSGFTCPICGSKNTYEIHSSGARGQQAMIWKQCDSCGRKWDVRDRPEILGIPV